MSNNLVEQELNPGLALFLRPSDFPVTCTHWICGAAHADPVAGDHYFVILMRAKSVLLMIPVFSLPKPYRCQVTDKVGHPGWVERDTFFDPCQVLAASIETVIESAARAGDLSLPGLRNRVEPAGLTSMLQAIRRHAASTMRAHDGAA